MDCHVFRRVCDELVSVLEGCRLEKIHQPAADVLQFTLYGSGQKRFLFFRFGRKTPFLFLSTHKVPVGIAPPASIMRLRKYLADKRIVAVTNDWLERRLYLRFNTEEEIWLCLDCKEGASLLFGIPPEAAVPVWPDPAHWETVCAEEGWRNWPVLTPSLRRTLQLLPPDEQAALLLDLEAGGGDLFLYETESGDRELSAWPLPASRRHINGQPAMEMVLEDPLPACALTGESQVLRHMASRSRTEAAKPHFAEAARLRRLLLKLDTEHDRLSRMAALQESACALQAELYRFAPEEKQAQVDLYALSEPLTLDPRLTIRENMTALFHKAARGKRGLALMEGRFNSVRESLEQAEQAALMAEAATSSPAVPNKASRSLKKPQLPKNILAFRSSDGFLILRGRDAKGNAQLLKLSAPYDLWMHTGGGSGAHVLIRRDYATQELPPSTVTEAAILAVLKSWRKDETQVDVITAFAKFVHPIRGARPGTVRIDKIEGSVVVTPDPALEERLCLISG